METCSRHGQLFTVFVAGIPRTSDRQLDRFTTHFHPVAPPIGNVIAFVAHRGGSSTRCGAVTNNNNTWSGRVLHATYLVIKQKGNDRQVRSGGRPGGLEAGGPGNHEMKYVCCPRWCWFPRQLDRTQITLALEIAHVGPQAMAETSSTHGLGPLQKVLTG